MGLNWLTFNTNIKSALLDIKFINDSIALVSGTGGVLFKWNSKRSVFTGVGDNSLDQLSLQIGPNPVADKLKIEISESKVQNLRFTVQNALGQIVFREQFLEAKQEIDMNTFPSGIYFIKIQNNSGQKVFKIVKE
jgi:hypothetical protein